MKRTGRLVNNDDTIEDEEQKAVSQQGVALSFVTPTPLPPGLIAASDTSASDSSVNHPAADHEEIGFDDIPEVAVDASVAAEITSVTLHGALSGMESPLIAPNEGDDFDDIDDLDEFVADVVSPGEAGAAMVIAPITEARLVEGDGLPHPPAPLMVAPMVHEAEPTPEAGPDRRWLGLVEEVIEVIGEMEDYEEELVRQPQGEAPRISAHVVERLTHLLARSGVAIIGREEQGATISSIGQSFDRAQHQPDAASPLPEEAQVAEVLRPGFMVGERVLRRARVLLEPCPSAPPANAASEFPLAESSVSPIPEDGSANVGVVTTARFLTADRDTPGTGTGTLLRGTPPSQAA